MLEKHLKSWQGKKVELTYIHKDKEGNVYCPIKAFEELKKDIIKQGFTYKETERTIEIDGTNQLFWKPRNTEPVVGTFNARATKYELLDGDRVLVNGYYPTKSNIVDHGEHYFIKQGSGGVEVKYKLIQP